MLCEHIFLPVQQAERSSRKNRRASGFGRRAIRANSKVIWLLIAVLSILSTNFLLTKNGENFGKNFWINAWQECEIQSSAIKNGWKWTEKRTLCK